MRGRGFEPFLLGRRSRICDGLTFAAGAQALASPSLDPPHACADLTRHFEFTKKLKAVAFEHGAKAYTLQQNKLRLAKTVPTVQGATSNPDASSGSSGRSRSISGAVSQSSSEPHTLQHGGASGRQRRRSSIGSSLTAPGCQRTSETSKRRASCAVDTAAAMAAAMATAAVLRSPEEPEPTLDSSWTSPFVNVYDASVPAIDEALVLCTAIKFADLGHTLKTFPIHERWSNLVALEFWAMGDKEKAMGAAVSPLCDRIRDSNVAQSQVGFFQFVCIPFYEVVADLIDPNMVPYANLLVNLQGWKDRIAKPAPAAAPAPAQDQTLAAAPSAAPTQEPAPTAPAPAPKSVAVPAAGKAQELSLEIV